MTFAYADSYYQLGKLQIEAGQTDAAIATLQAGEKLNPQNAAVHDELAIAYRNAGREPEAQQEEKTSHEGTVLGYAYASPYRTRSAYRFTVEDSIYVAPNAARRGIGLALLRGLIERCAAAGYRQMIAVIGDSANMGSVGLHERAGFQRVGLLPHVGFKHGRWVDCVLMQRALGDGANNSP